VITVAAAVQLAGFRHVVGTLWASRDSISARFVDSLYRDLAAGGLRADGTARGVHMALGRLRGRYGIPAAWAPFAHVGP
jgi:CHAT domain-containing protein